MTDKKKGRSPIGTVIGTVVFLLLFFIAALVTWTLGYWHDITFDEIVFYLSSPLEGTAGNVVTAFILKVAVPTVLAAVIFAVLSVILCKKDKDKARKILAAILITAAALVSVIQLIRADKRYGILRYIRSQNSSSEFVDNYYVAPTKNNVKFPEKKRNLIFIYLESMETTYTDKAHGGDFDSDVIPELRELALKDGECFEGNREKLNGGHVITGATYTMSGIVAQTAGIPIAGGKTNAATAHADTFYPGIRILGDILKDEGYSQSFMCGSPVSFGSREVYLRSHGCEDFFDYDYAAANGYIPKGYKVWWGFEDRKLFEFAKTKVADMASSDKPFALTILTADTHFEDGYVCDLCDNKFDTQYSNVIACSSKRVAEFVKWLKEQDFYENTTVILSGDHITMDADYCKDVDPNYERRTYTNIINPAVFPAGDRHREYTTFDIFPTTLAAIGAKIEGNRLGLGTNLFSDNPTLYERFGRATLEEELTKDSRFFKEIAKYDPLSKSILEDLNYLDMECAYKDPGMVEVSFWGIDRAGLVIDSVKGEFYGISGDMAATCEFTLGPDKSWRGTFKTVLSYREAFGGRLKLTAKDSSGEEHVFFENTDGRSIFRSEDIQSYLKNISGLKNVTVFVAAKENAIFGLSKKVADSFGEVGLDCMLFGSGQNTYCGVSGTNLKDENISNAMLTLKGSVNGMEYEITSADNVASIVINKKEYSPDQPGFNFVVFDEQSGKVIDRASYNLSPEAASHKLSSGNVDLGIRYNGDKKTADLWISGKTPEAFAARQLHVYLFIWDKNDPKEFKRITLSQGRQMTYRDGSVVPYYFAKDLDVSAFDPSSFGVMLFFVDDSDGAAVYKTRILTDLGKEEYRDPQMPSYITFKEE